MVFGLNVFILCYYFVRFHLKAYFNIR